MLGVSSLPSQPEWALRGGQQPRRPCPCGCALPRLSLDHLHHLSALLQFPRKTPVMGSFPSDSVPYKQLGSFLAQERRDHPGRIWVLLPAASLETRALFCFLCRSLKPQLHSRPGNRRHAQPALVSVLLPGLKGHVHKRRSASCASDSPRKGLEETDCRGASQAPACPPPFPGTLPASPNPDPQLLRNPCGQTAIFSFSR